MIRPVRLLMTWLAAFAAAWLFMAAGATAQPIRNTAQLDVMLGGVNRSVSSNTVTADRILAPSPAQVTLLRSSEGGSALAAGDGWCRDAAGAFLPIARGVQGTMQVAEAGVYRAGEDIAIRLVDPNRNNDSQTRETVELTVTSGTGDEERLRLLETAPDTGVFVATIASVPAPPAATKFDCRLTVAAGTMITVRYADLFYPGDTATAYAIVDPVEFVFDSRTGEPLNGATVTIIDLATGRPATVFGDDGRSAFPATLVSGAVATDASGRTYTFPTGGFRFPSVPPGSYRFEVTPPVGYIGPSQVPAADLVRLPNPLGASYTIEPGGSFGQPFVVNGATLFRIDIPLDRQRLPLLVTKAASVREASAGDFIQYRVTVQNLNAQAAVSATALLDTMAGGLRYQSGSLRVGGRKVADPAVDASGSGLRIELGTVPGATTLDVTYVVQVTPAARVGDALNRVRAIAGGTPASNEARAAVRINPLLNTDAATIIGRVLNSRCDAPADEAAAAGVAGVRLLMEDGTFTLSDADGLFHFEGVRPGVHVVQLDLASVPDGWEAVDCARNTRSAGRAFSQFVDVRGGALWRTDFHLRRKPDASPVTEPAAQATAAVVAATDGEAPDWFAGQSAGNAFLFPGTGHNPRSPATRVVVKHLPGTTVRLSVNGEAAPALAFDGARDNADATLQVSQWRGLALKEGANQLSAEIVRDSAVLETLRTSVHYANLVARAELVPGRSRMVADGRTRPVLAIRLTDRHGKPVRDGVTGGFALSSPYRMAEDIDLQQARQLTGGESARPAYRVTGDEGIALVELAPTTQAGSIELAFTHEVDRRRIDETVKGWLQPGDQPWVVVGLAAGTLGYEALNDHVEALERPDADKTIRDGQVSLYAKGRVLGRWLLTVAYDSDKETGRDARRPLGGVIDPQRYYDIYGDGTEQAYDAASGSKIYLRLERANFMALFGDYETGLTDTELTRYSRSFTGARAEYDDGTLSAEAFAAETAFRYARDEIQGSGLSSLYRLTRRNIVLNSDKVRIETRDRFRSKRILDSRPLVRHIDYDIDYAAGTLRFRAPVPSRDGDFNPVFIVADYETQGVGSKTLNAGGRVAARLSDGRIEAGASAIHEEDLSATTDLGGVDVTVKLRRDTELRVEAAHSRTRAGGETRDGSAYLAEVEHRGGRVDALAYYRQQDTDFGVGQLYLSESGSRKYGVDAQLRVTDAVSVSGAAWRQEALAGDATRTAGRVLAEYRRRSTALRAGYQFAQDDLADGRRLRSSQLLAGASHALFDDRLRVDLDTATGLGGSDSADFPDRYRLGLSFAVRPDVRLLAAHEISDGAGFDAATTSVGIDAAPWHGARLSSAVNQQATGENGARTYALYGLAQSFVIDPRWSVDLSIDGSRTLAGEIRRDTLVTPAFPPASGGQLDTNGTFTDDFWAVSAGATYRGPALSWNGRAEYRAGDLRNQFGVQTAVLRQTRGGISMAALAQFNRVDEADGTSATLGVLNGSLAWRPLGSRWSALDKLELRWDEVENGTGTTDGLLGANGPAVVGDARSRRIVNNLAVNLHDQRGGDAERAQLSLYWGAKYVFDSFDGDEFAGLTQVVGTEARWDITPKVDFSLNAAVRHSAASGTVNWLVGPSVGVSPAENLWLSVGYNVTGFDDRDFDDARYTRRGAFVKLRFKFDQDTPAALFGRGARK